jgi:PAS domain S-box-containing protein
MTAPTLSRSTQLDATPLSGAGREVLGGVLSSLSELHELVVVCDEQQRVRWFSDRLGVVAHDADEPLGQHVDKILSGAANGELASLHEQVATRLGNGAAHVALRTRSGVALNVVLSAFRLPDDPKLTVVVARTADEADRSAAALRNNSDYLAAILDCAPDAVIATDRGGFVSYANPGACALFKASAEDLAGRPLASCLPCTSQVAAVLDGVHEGDVTSHALEIGQGDDTRWLSVSSRRLRLPNGDATGNVVYLRDITEHHRTQLELQAKAEELEHYVAHVSHDLRTPLSSVLGFVRMLRQDFDDQLGTQGRHFLERIEQGGNTMETLITDLLELSRIGHADDDELVDPLPILRKIANDWKEHLDAQHVRIELPKVPPMLLCNRTRLYQLFANLVGNALVHMGPRPDACVRVEISETETHHHIAVIDNGKGIASEHHARIFDVFATLGRRNDGRKSTGIGLAIVRKIATTHGGRVWVESQPDRGSKFNVTLARD